MEFIRPSNIIGNLAGPAAYYVSAAVGWLDQVFDPVYRTGEVRLASGYRLCVLTRESVDSVQASVKRCIAATSRRITEDFGPWMRVPFVHVVLASQMAFEQLAARDAPYFGGTRTSVDGSFYPDLATVFVGMEWRDGFFEHVLVHELVHASLSRWEVPRRIQCTWAYEGYAYCVAHDLALPREMRFELVRRIDHVGELPSGKAFRKLLTLTKPEKLSSSCIVAAELFVRFLLGQPARMRVAARRFLLGALLRHWPAKTCVARCEQALGQDIGRVETAFHSFCERLLIQARKADEPRKQAQRCLERNVHLS
jgi:hypothetical protein